MKNSKQYIDKTLLLVDEFSSMSHFNFKSKTSLYFDFLSKSILDNKIDFDNIIRNEKDSKKIFLAMATCCILDGWSEKTSKLLDLYETKVGNRYLLTLVLNLKLFLSVINSRRGGENRDKILDVKPTLAKNIAKTLYSLNIKMDEEKIIDNFFKKVIYIDTNKSVHEPMELAFVLDDLNPSKTATLTKLMFDMVAVILENTSHCITIFNSRLHTPDNLFWMPGVHQTRLVSFEDMLAHYDIDLNKYIDRLKIIHLNDLFYKNEQTTPILIDVFVTFPFKHNILERVIYKYAPVVEIEILNGMSSAKHCDIVITNGIPSQEFIKENFVKVSLIQAPRRKFKGVQKDEFLYIKGFDKFIVTAGKDFDKRSEQDINKFIESAANFIEKTNDYSWVFIGASNMFQNKLETKYSYLLRKRKFINIAYEHDLPGLLKQAYLYIQPPIMGGGRVPSIAIENNCMALSFKFGDCTKYVPNKFQFDTIDEILTFVISLENNSNIYNNLLNEQKVVCNGSTNYESAISYESAMFRAKAKFYQRNNND